MLLTSRTKGNKWICTSEGFHNVSITDCAPAHLLPTPEDEAHQRKQRFERKLKKLKRRGYSKEAATRELEHTYPDQVS